MTSPLFRKPNEIPHDLVNVGLTLLWGFGIIGAGVFVIEGFVVIGSLLSGNDFPGPVTKGAGLFDMAFLLVLVLQYLLVSKQKYRRTTSLLSALCCSLLIKDLFLIVDTDSRFFVALAYIFSTVIGFLTFTFFNRHRLVIPMKQMDIPDVDYGQSPLQVDVEGKVFIPSKSCEYHVDIVGGTGTGKSFKVILPFIRQDIVKNRIGAFIYDAKSEMARMIAFYIEEAGREKEFKYFDLGCFEKSMTYNPLYSGTADEIANKVFTGLYYDKDKESPHYSKLASAFLNNLISLLKKEIEVLTFEDLFNATVELDTFKTINRLCQKYPKTPQAKYLTSDWLQKPVRQRQEELIGLINNLQRFCTREWSPLINSRNPDIKMNEVFEYNQILLFGASTMKNPDDAKPLMIMALKDIAQQTAARFQKRPPKTFRVYLDEFYHLAHSGFIQTLNLARSGRVSYILAHQSLGDLEMIGPAFADQVDINTRNKIILRQDNSKSAEYFSKLLGTEEEVTTTQSFDTRSLLKTPSGVTEKLEHKFLYNPNVIKNLPDDEAIVRLAFPNSPLVRRIKIPNARKPTDDFKMDKILKTLNRHLVKQEETESEERLDLLQERRIQEPADPTIKNLDAKYSRGRKTPKRV